MGWCDALHEKVDGRQRIYCKYDAGVGEGRCADCIHFSKQNKSEQKESEKEE